MVIRKKNRNVRAGIAEVSLTCLVNGLSKNEMLSAYASEAHK